ncbi:MAG: fused MFS/spermidine synthase [Betaproteobacteria bacterium]|nr:fused MFS/spermidine synthase [Betaproteobacteria bacterium]
MERGSRLSLVNRRLFLNLGLSAFAALFVLACAAQTVIYETTSRFGAIIVTESPDGLRTLMFERDGARQSAVRLGDPDHLELPYARVAMAGLALCEDPRRILVVGLGGGTLPTFLRRHYPTATIDAVDIDPKVVDVAKRFFGFREDERMRAYVEDGRRFIERVAQGTYDVIFLDAFGTEAVPSHLTTQEFLRAVRRALNPRGVAVGNVWKRSSNRLYDSMVRTYREVFEELHLVDVVQDVNMMVFALPRRQALSRNELAELASKLSAAKQFRFDLSEFVHQGYVLAQDHFRGGQVLRDRNSNQ